MPALIDRRLLALPALAGVAALLLATHSATAQSGTGTITGRVLWGGCVRAIPLPMTPEGQLQPIMPDNPNLPQPVPGPRHPGPVNGLPAGAVLVAVQNTAVSARTDEAGRFTLSGAPTGQYMTVAAGPVANAASATAERPNVFVTAGQTVDLGTLSLGGPSPYGLACRGYPGVAPASGIESTEPGSETAVPPSDAPNP